MSEPQLIDVIVPRSPDAAVLVLHGGASRKGSPMVSPTQLSVLRMTPIARRIARAGRGRLAVFRVLNTHRGWDTSHTPVHDAEWAMNKVSKRLGDLPLGLVGHSLGGRAALLAGERAQVRTVVALAPWVYGSESPSYREQKVLIVHGSADRIAKPERSEALARRLARDTDLGYICIAGGKHAMLSHHRRFDGYAAAFTAATLLPDPTARRIPAPLQRVLDGETWVDG